jgi:anti-sigma regulatory factor (Ser/Thr protein kinase)
VERQVNSGFPEGIYVDLPGGPWAGAEARAALDSIGEELDSRTLDDLRLLVTELVSNGVRHGNAGPRQRVRLRVTLEPETVRVEVTDPGPGLLHGFEPAGNESAGGWGLVLVERVATRWGTIDGESCVWFELDRA